jgi:hypothetical protein
MGIIVTNWTVKIHTQAGGLYEVTCNRHHGQQGVDATTSIADRDQWRAVVGAAKSSMTDDEFRAVVASVWPGWTSTNLGGALAGEYRAHVLSVVDP